MTMNRLFTFLALFSFGLLSSASAQQPNCPISCFASHSSTESGVLPDCAFFVAELYAPEHGTARSLITLDPVGVTCNTCGKCEFRVAITWDFTACPVPTGFSYNQCAQVSGAGFIPRTLKLGCGEFETVTYEVGELDSSFDPALCEGSPFNGGAVFSTILDLACGGC